MPPAAFDASALHHPVLKMQSLTQSHIIYQENEKYLVSIEMVYFTPASKSEALAGNDIGLITSSLLKTFIRN